MIVFIQHRKTMDYLTPDRKWTPDGRKALSFPTSSEAFAYCVEHSLGDCDILVRFGGSTPDVRLPFRPGQAAGAPRNSNPPAES